MLGRLLAIYGSIIRAFGFTVKPLFTFWIYTWLWSFNTVTLWLDHLLFPGHRRKTIDRPVLIVGTPRSGTTFLQRFLADNFDFCSFRVWQMIVPSILGQKLFRPFLKPLARFSPTRHAEEVHKTGLEYVETDDALLSVRFIDGFFVYAWFLAWDTRDPSWMFDVLGGDTPQVRRYVRFHQACVRRLLHSSGAGRFLGKPFVFTMQPTAVLKQYPDAKLIYLVRDPKAVIPSGMSLLTKLSNVQRDTSKVDDATRARFHQRLYDGELQFYKRFHDAYTGGQLSDDNVLVVRFPDMMERFDQVMDQITEFAGLDVDDATRATIAETADKQRAHVSKHKYDLATYGLTAEQIEADLGYVYDTFDLPR